MMADANALTKVRECAQRMALHGTVSAVALVAGFVTAAPAVAQEKATAQRAIQFNIEAQELGEALNVFAAQSGLQMALAPNDVRGKRSPAVQGTLTPRAALDRLFESSGLEYAFLNGNTVAVRQGASTQEKQADRPDAQMPTGVLTGRVTQAGEPVAGATVTATSASLKEPRVVTTDEDGVYRLSDLPPGVYSLRFENDGLAPADKEARVSPEKSTTLDIQMSLHEVREEVVVTGSRIRRAEVEGPSPVIFITREDLDRSGRSTVAEALAQLPQNFTPPTQGVTGVQSVNLRGLGADNTLVLVNGRRVANSGIGSFGSPTSQVDLNSIPLAAVERIEVLTDGASAVYGSDAVGGVVNIILKEDFRGSEVSVNSGASVEGGAGERRISFTTGGAKGGLRGLLSGEYFDRSRLSVGDRPFSRSSDQTARGGTDFRFPFANPGNVFSLDGQPLPGVGAPSAGIPTGQDGRDLTPEDFVATADQLNLSTLAQDLIPESERVGVSGQFHWDLPRRLALFAEAGANRSTTETGSVPPLLFVTVPASNPFNPFGQDVQVQGLLAELGSAAQTPTETVNTRGVVGLDGPLGEAGTWETALGYSRDEFDATQTLDIVQTVLTDLLNRTDPETALNVFGDGAGANRPEVLAELEQSLGFQSADGVAEVLSWEGKLDGMLADWAGRELRGAAGAEYREESLDNTTLVFGVNLQTPSRTTFEGGDREVEAGFVELSLPLIGPKQRRTALQELELQLAGRFESYSDFGETFNPRVALRWQPIEALALRASWSTGFRAPALQELFLEFPNFVTPVSDPRRNNESVVVDVLQGGNPDLEPEESESWNLGLVWDVPFVQGLSTTADVYSVRQTDQIGLTPPRDLLSQLGLEDFFPERITRAAPTPEDVAAGLPGRVLAVDFRAINLSSARVRGVDLGLKYLKETAVGHFDLGLNGAYIDSLTRQVTPVAPVEDLEGTTGASLFSSSGGNPARFRSNLSLFWSRGPWELGVTERYTGRLRDTRSPVNERVDDHYETDLQLNYRWPGSTGPLEGSRLSLSVENVFNAEPPFQDIGVGFNTTLHSPRQAFYSLTLTKAF